MVWRNCYASNSLVVAINNKYPRRDKSSDGTIGDAAHATRVSDHNPWVFVNGIGVVRARDVDKDGVDAAWIVEELRKLGSRGDPRLAHGGYVIFNRRITSSDFSHWNAYTGSNPHDKHFHVSFSLNQPGFDSTAGWAFLGGAPPKPAAPTATRLTVKLGDKGGTVQQLQAILIKQYPSYNRYKVDGIFGPLTEAGVKEFQRRSGLPADGIVGPKTWAKLL